MRHVEKVDALLKIAELHYATWKQLSRLTRSTVRPSIVQIDLSKEKSIRITNVLAHMEPIMSPSCVFMNMEVLRIWASGVFYGRFKISHLDQSIQRES